MPAARAVVFGPPRSGTTFLMSVLNALTAAECVTGNLLPVIFGLGAISAAKYPDGVLAEQSRRLRHLLQRVAPDTLADEHFAEEVEAGVADTEAVGIAPEVAGQPS